MAVRIITIITIIMTVTRMTERLDTLPAKLAITIGRPTGRITTVRA